MAYRTNSFIFIYGITAQHNAGLEIVKSGSKPRHGMPSPLFIFRNTLPASDRWGSSV